MKATFKLKFGIDKDGNIGLSIEWVEEKQRVMLPQDCWPHDSDSLRCVALAFFPTYKLRVDSAKRRKGIRERERERYYKKLVPEQEEFEIESASGKRYQITVIDRGKGRNFHCSCPDYAFRRKKQGQYCKHIAEWLKKKEHPVAHEIAVQDDAPSTRNIPVLMRKINRTLRTYDCDEFLEEEFAQKVYKQLKCRSQLSNSGSTICARHRTKVGSGLTAQRR